MSHAARLRAVLKSEEIRIVALSQNADLSSEMINILLAEMARKELRRILAAQDAVPHMTDAEIDDRIATLRAEGFELKRDARANNFARVDTPVRMAAEAIHVELPAGLSGSLGRRAIELLREIVGVECRTLDGDDGLAASQPIAARFCSGSVEDFLTSRPILLTECWKHALTLYPSKDMKGNIDAITKVAIAYFGDVPIASISKEALKAFFVWMARLPKYHGKAHGKNRFCREASKGSATIERSKQDDIDAADAADAEAMRRISEMNHLSTLEQRALFAEELTPRLTLRTIERNCSGFSRLLRAASDVGGDAGTASISFREIKRAIVAAEPTDPLYIRVTKPKIRMPWTEERLAQFLTSPLYTGCFSAKRRSRPGSVIVRDSLYWVPLIVLTIGSRIEEILLLKRNSLRRRNGCLCLAINVGQEVNGKSVDAERYVPVPQLLIDLDFIEWIQSLDDDHGPLLFPEAAMRGSIGDVTGPFSKALNHVLDTLGLSDFGEDFYAVRKTLSSMLRAAEVPDGQRQAIARHRAGDILNLHYTAHHPRDLKIAIDKADFRIEIERSEHHGFPVIRSCGMAPAQSFDVDVVLAEDGNAEVVRVLDRSSGAKIFEFSQSNVAFAGNSKSAAAREAGKILRKVTGEGHLRLPKSPLKRLPSRDFMLWHERSRCSRRTDRS